MIRFLDLTTRRFGGARPHMKPGHLMDVSRLGAAESVSAELRARVPVFILTALWLASGIAFFALIFIAMFL